jgi:hypothetical protein
LEVRENWAKQKTASMACSRLQVTLKHGGRVMIVASSVALGKSDTLAKLANDLEGFVLQAAQNDSSFYDFERGTLDRVLGIGFSAVNLYLRAKGKGDLGPRIETAQGTFLYRSDAVENRPLRTIFGEHTFQQYVYSQGNNRKIELKPIDASINLPEGKASYLLQEFTQLFCVEKAFGVAARQFDTVFGQKLSVDVLENINRDMGEQADRFLDALPTPPSSEEGAILVATADGKGVPLVRADAEKVPAFEEKERPGNRRMATLGCVYSVNRHVRTAEQIVAALFRDRTVDQPEKRPEPCFKRYRGYFTEVAEQAEDVVPGTYRTWTWITQEVTARHQSGQPIIRLMDGQPSLLDAADVCLEEFIKELEKLGHAHVLVDILDIIHVSGYVWKAAKAFYSHKEHQEHFAQERLLRILRGEVSGVVTGMRRMASQRGLKGAALKAVTTACNYFEKNAHRMRYDAYLQAGYPIASGVIEGACRHVIKDRMEQGGMRWRLEGAEAMLHVRSVCASSEWDNFGRWRQAEEAKRIHPHRELVEKHLGFAA